MVVKSCFEGIDSRNLVVAVFIWCKGGWGAANSLRCVLDGTSMYFHVNGGFVHGSGFLRLKGNDERARARHKLTGCICRGTVPVDSAF